MRVSTEFGNSETIKNLGTGKIFALLSLPITERETFLEENPVNEMTTRELQQATKDKIISEA